MIMDHLYTIVSEKSSEGESSSFTITVNSSHPIYSGHFPGFPVTPGVVELEIIKELAGKMLNANLKIKKISNCKFTYIINPMDVGELTVNIAVELKDEDYKVVAQILDSDHSYLRLNVTFGLAL